ncbi:MAG TPA: hypothetical protein VNH18_29470 [Bryobacteraceae bacterium]|nr:hypothetical protein [Blastocatellia bacterium]HXJ43448.1 hypothetical protein [Bryobacteraceae bacterium]
MAKEKSSGLLVQSSIRFKADLKKRVDFAVLDRGTSLQAAIHEALEAWLLAIPANAGIETSTSNEKVAVLQVTSSLQKSNQSEIAVQSLTALHEQLEHILKHGPPTAIAAITSNLEAFSLLTDLAGAPHGEIDRPATEESDIQQGMDRSRALGARAEELAERIGIPGAPAEKEKTKHPRKATRRSGN